MEIPPFTISDEILSLVAEISMSIGSITALMQDDAPNPILRKENRIKTIQSSLAIENNSLTIDQVTAIMEGKRVLGAPNEIQEVKNAIDAYHLMQQINPHSEKDLLKAHRLMMQDLIKENGKYRSSGVGVFGNEGIVHLAPPPMMVPQLMADLFAWIKTTKTHPLVSSCVFHYEFEFIHPFADGNGRMGRFWQTALLSRFNPVFLWLPVETIVKQHQ
ncbi:MAG: Fic family protein, partial [Bacteroidales bacterium]|nr:Fic family protein [Bacteroidales bacterium]